MAQQKTWCKILWNVLNFNYDYETFRYYRYYSKQQETIRDDYKAMLPKVKYYVITCTKWRLCCLKLYLKCLVSYNFHSWPQRSFWQNCCTCLRIAATFKYPDSICGQIGNLFPYLLTFCTFIYNTEFIDFNVSSAM